MDDASAHTVDPEAFWGSAMIDSRTFAPVSVLAKAARMVVRLGDAVRARGRPKIAFASGPEAARPGAWGLLAGNLGDRSR